MAEGKKSVIIYSDLIHTVRKLPREKAGDLLMVILEYINDLNPVVEDMMVELVFEPIKQQMKRDLKKWEETKGYRSDSGKLGGIKSGEARRIKAELKKQNEANEASASKTKQTKQTKQTQANEAVNVNVTVNDTVNDTVNVNDKEIDDVEKEKKSPPTSKLYSIKELENVEIAENEFTLLACRRSNKSVQEIKPLFDEFIKEQKAVNKLAWQNEPDAKKHFHNWIAKKKTPTSQSKFVP